MNVYDGERMAEMLGAEGMAVASENEADLVILNTCHIREKAAEKVYSDIGRMRRDCLLYTSPSPRDRTRSRMPSSA